MSWNTSTPSRSASAGISVGGPTTRTSAAHAWSAGGCWSGRRGECSTSPQIATASPSSRPLRRRMVSASSSAWVGCSCVPSPALITAASTFCASRFGAPDWSWRTTSRSQCIAFSVAGGVQQRLALVHRGGGDRHVDDVGAQPLAGELEAGAGAGAVLEEQVDQGAPAQQVALGLAGPVEQHVALGEVEQMADRGRFQPFDREEVLLPVGHGR